MGWSSFNNGGAEFSYFADTWPAVLGETGPGQVMRIRNAGLPDRYLGIYQTVSVVPGQAYTLSLSGLVRTNSGDVNYSKYGYRLQRHVQHLRGICPECQEKIIAREVSSW